MSDPKSALYEIGPKGIALVELGTAMGMLSEQWGAIRAAALHDCTQISMLITRPPMPNLDDFVACTEELTRAASALRMYYDAPREPSS